MKRKIFGVILGIMVLAAVVLLVNASLGVTPPNSEVINTDTGALEGIIDISMSTASYTGYGIGKQHSGTFAFSDTSTLVIDDRGWPTAGTVVFDMTKITADAPGLAGHLKNEDFFNVEMYPEASYKITETIATPLDPDHDLIVNGELTLLDQTHAHNVAATFNPGTGELVFTTSIDRTKWGIDFNSQVRGEDFGDRLIEDRVDLNMVIDID